MRNILQPYRHIAWDFDDTLVGHATSPDMWQYIIDNPHGQQHSIITMRSHGMQTQMFKILAQTGSPLRPEHFTHILNVPDQLYTGHATLITSLQEDHEYRFWKGKMCEQIGAGVLVDDMEDGNISTAGCLRHNIVHVHPDCFIS